MHCKGIASVFVAFCFLSDPASAQKWGAHVDVEAKPGTKRSIGEADFFLPLFQDDRTLWFGNARLRVADHDNREGNLGVGVRRMLDGGWNLGGYGYFDRRRTSTGNKFNQVTLGAEALGRDFDFRGNAYLPQGDRVRDLGSTTVGGVSTAALVGTAVQVTTSASTTLRSEEHALKGYDLEAGWRVPIWAAEADKQLRLYAGGYRFSDNGIRVSGPRVRAEFAMYDLPALWKGAQLMLGAEYQNDDARGGQGFVSARIRIPLGSETASGQKLNWQERRMAAPVVRDVDVITRSRSVATASTPAVVEIATATANGQAITVLSDATTTGAALPGAVAAAGVNSVVILTGTFNPTATTVLQPGQTLMGAGTLQVLAPSGATAPLTTPGATISVVNVQDAISVASNSVLSGLNIANTSGFGPGAVGRGVLVTGGVSGATISNNVITVTTSGGTNAFGIQVEDGTNITIQGNTSTANASNGGAIGAAGFLSVPSAGIVTSFTLSGNSLGGTGASFNEHTRIDVGTGSVTVLPGSTGNVVLFGTCGGATTTAGSASYTNGTTCP